MPVHRIGWRTKRRPKERRIEWDPQFFPNVSCFPDFPSLTSYHNIYSPSHNTSTWSIVTRRVWCLARGNPTLFLVFPISPVIIIIIACHHLLHNKYSCTTYYLDCSFICPSLHPPLLQHENVPRIKDSRQMERASKQADELSHNPRELFCHPIWNHHQVFIPRSVVSKVQMGLLRLGRQSCT